jgi:hypothetical protein
MKRYFNREKFLSLCVMMMSVCTLMAQEGKVLTQYKGETEIKDPVSITLKSGFFIPEGQNVRIYTGRSFENNVPSLWSPSVNQNYIRSRVFKMPGVNSQNIDSERNTSEVNQTVQYIDGLGRVLQTVTVQGSPNHKDLVQPMAYDAFGREQFKYLPYPSSSGNGSFKPASITEQKDFYNNPIVGIPLISNSAFSETKFENSPLNRVLEQGAPGGAWQLSSGHTQKMSYETNLTGEVKLWEVTVSGAVAV